MFGDDLVSSLSLQQRVIGTLKPPELEAAYSLLCAFKEESQRRSPLYDELRSDYRDVLSRYVDDHQARGDRCILVARSGDGLIGIIVGAIWDYLPFYKIARMGYISDLYVAPAVRGRGIGSALIREMEKWFREQGVEFARIETINAYDGNQRLYERLGYEPFLVELRRRLT